MTKEELKEYRDMRAEIDELSHKIMMLGVKAETARQPHFSHMPKGVPQISMEDLIAKKVDYERLLVEKRIKLLNKAMEIEHVIDYLPVNERRVMRKRYIDGWRWEDFEEAYEKGEIEFCSRTAKRLHGYALQKIQYTI